MDALIFAFGVFFLGLLIGYFMRVLIVRHSGYSGTINVTHTPDKTLYLLELAGEPEELENEKEVIFRVNIHPMAGVTQENHGV
jgi:hypothetical protein